MARFIAVHNIPGITEEDSRSKLDAVKKWRPDRRTTIVKVYGDLENGSSFPNARPSNSRTSRTG